MTTTPLIINLVLGLLVFAGILALGWFVGIRERRETPVVSEQRHLEEQRLAA